MEFTIQDMHCSHCVQSITKAIQVLDAKATVTADLQTHKITVETSASEDEIRNVISAIGFDPQST